MSALTMMITDNCALLLSRDHRTLSAHTSTYDSQPSTSFAREYAVAPRSAYRWRKARRFAMLPMCLWSHVLLLFSSPPRDRRSLLPSLRCRSSAHPRGRGSHVVAFVALHLSREGFICIVRARYSGRIALVQFVPGCTAAHAVAHDGPRCQCWRGREARGVCACKSPACWLAGAWCCFVPPRLGAGTCWLSTKAQTNPQNKA